MASPPIYSDPNAVPDTGGFVPNSSIDPNGSGMSDVFGAGINPTVNPATGTSPDMMAAAPPTSYAPYGPQQPQQDPSAALAALFGSSSDLNWADLNEKKREFDATNAVAQQQLALNQGIATGTVNGSPTLANTLQQANIAAQQAGMTGQFNGAPTQAAILQQANIAAQQQATANATAGVTGWVAPNEAAINTAMGAAPNYQGNFTVADMLASPGYQNWLAQQKAINPSFNANNGYGGLGTPTEQAREFNATNANNQANMILTAPKGAADTFSYLAKLRGLAQAGSLGQMMGGALQQATGQGLSQLQSNPNYSNVNLANDVVSAMNGGQVSPAGQRYLGSTLGLAQQPQANPMAQTGSGDPTSQLISALQQSSPAMNTSGMLQGAGAGRPNLINGGGSSSNFVDPGTYSQQDYSKLDPSLQSAFQDYNQTNYGTDPNDLIAAMKQAAPSSAFSQTNYGKF